jgi:hypothetical protein
MHREQETAIFHFLCFFLNIKYDLIFVQYKGRFFSNYISTKMVATKDYLCLRSSDDRLTVAEGEFKAIPKRVTMTASTASDTTHRALSHD